MTKPLSGTVDLLKALAHPVRLRILAMLRGGELCLCQMTAVLDLAASTVSAHLGDLKRAGLVEERKDGRWVFHRLADGEEASGAPRAGLREPSPATRRSRPTRGSCASCGGSTSRSSAGWTWT